MSDEPAFFNLLKLGLLSITKAVRNGTLLRVQIFFETSIILLKHPFP